MSRKRLCCIFNYASHYRLPIYRKLDKEMGAAFYFGANLPGGEKIKKFDVDALHGFVKERKVHSLGAFRWTSGWLRIAFNGEYDRFLITQDLYAIDQWALAIVCKMLGKPVYVWTHGLKSPDPKRQGSRTTRLLRCWYDRLVTGYFLYGDRAKENMYLAGFDIGKLHPVYNSLDYDTSLAQRGLHPRNPYKEHFGNDRPVLAFIGRLTEVKRLGQIMEVHDIIKGKGIGTNVVFIGDGPEKAALEQSVRPEHRSEFWFAGAKYDEDEIHEYLYHATVCLSPGNVGLTAINCLSHGLPVITNDDFDTQMPESEAIVPGKTGDFFRNGDITDFADKTARWITKLSSSDAREETRLACYGAIDDRYNPDYQMGVFRSVIYGRHEAKGETGVK